MMRSAKRIDKKQQTQKSAKKLSKKPIKVVKSKKEIVPKKRRVTKRQVEIKAYELYVERGLTHGNDQNDWYEAERLLKAS